MMRRKGDVVGAFLHELDPLPTSLFLKLLFFFFMSFLFAYCNEFLSSSNSCAHKREEKEKSAGKKNARACFSRKPAYH